MLKNFKLALIFRANMIIQANKPIRVYGKCKKHVDITVKMLDQEKTIRTTKEFFVIELKPEKPLDKSFSFSVSCKKQKETIKNVLIGDVFLFIGGKNLSQTLNASSKEDDYQHEQIRLFDLEKDKKWLVSGKDSINHLSVFSYLYAKNLHKKLKQPIGVVTYSKEDENIFSWANKATITSDREMKNYLNGILSMKDYNLSRDFQYLKNHYFGYQFKSVIFSQGENDFYHYHFYERALKDTIESYRDAFNDQQLTFYIIQIPSFVDAKNNYIAPSEIRIAQSNLCYENDYIHLVSVVDIEETGMISMNKSILSKRLVNMVLERQYNQTTEKENAVFPQIASYKKFRNRVEIFIDEQFGSLESKSGSQSGFYYTVDRADYYPVEDVKINGNKITVKVPRNVKEIRYAYDDNPMCDIYSNNGLPLLPFKIVFNKAS
ncbi:MAG: hypothetical protein PF513_03415 [Tenericutes bacterium]|jgi:sialate O-acetylesterase|nr:hypothetical protein [Mycoplasmatota bacterium]